eukprot:4831483-Pyramimonas_sp.AAC.1
MKDKSQAWGDEPTPVYGAVTQPTVLATLRQIVASPIVFKSPCVPISPKDQALHKAVYGVQVFVTPGGHCQAGPPAYG